MWSNSGKEGILQTCAEHAEAIGLREKLWIKLKDEPTPPIEKLKWQPDVETFFQLFYVENMKRKELTEIFGVSRSTIRDYIRRHGFYKRVPLNLQFQGTQRDKDYIVGLRLADLHVSTSTTGIRVCVVTTRPGMGKLVQNILGDYAVTHKNPVPPSKWSIRRLYGWGIYVHLGKDFAFLLPKQIPPKLNTDHMAGLIDGDGSTRISPVEGKYLSYEVAFYNQRRELVDTYYDSLLDLGFSANPPRERRRDTGRLELTVSVTGKDDVRELLHKLELRHPDKHRWKQLILKSTNEDHREIIRKAEILRRQIRQAANEYCQNAETEYRRRHSKHPLLLPFLPQSVFYNDMLHRVR